MKIKAIYLMDADLVNSAFGPQERRELEGRVDFITEPLTAEGLSASNLDFSTVEAIFSGWGVPRMDEAFLLRFPALRVVFHAAGSVKSFVTEALWARNIRVTCAARVNAIPVAEFTLSQVIFCLKHGWQRVRELREERLYRKEDGRVPSNYKSVVGILSLGHAGRLVAEYLRILDVSIIAYDPLVDADTAASLGVELCSLTEVFERADLVTCHTPLLPSTVGMLRGQHFSRLKQGATFINTARGGLVNESELIAVLRERTDVFALLDVTDPEPPGPNSGLFLLPNVVITPHIAGSVARECLRMGSMMVDELRQYLQGEALAGVVEPEQLRSLA